MRPLVQLRDALADPHLFEPLLGGPTWRVWRTILIAAMGEALDDEERVIFEKFTGRAIESLQLVECLVVIAGRRGGKSLAASVLAVFIAALCDHSGKTVRGERPLVLCLAQNQRQAKVTFSYIAGIVDACPLLAEMIANRTADTLTLSNGVSIEVRAASFRGLRGVTALAVLADETCFWRSEETSRNADSEILDAVRPALATTGGPLIMISSPYSRRGETWELFKRHYGPAGDPLILVAQGASRDFNESLPQRVVDRAMEADPASAAAEYLGQWRTDLEVFVSLEVVGALVDSRVFERGYLAECKYHGFVDPSGGSADSFTMAIAHLEGVGVVLDAVREVRPPFSPENVAKDFSELLKAYGVVTVHGDRYGGDWPAEQFRKHGVQYVPSDKTRSEIYLELLPLLNSARVSLLDNSRVISQLCALERRTSRVGKDSVDHPQGGHDDLINAAAGAIVFASRQVAPLNFHVPCGGPSMSDIIAASGGGVGLGDSAPPGGWPAGSTQAAASGPFANLGWTGWKQ
jgi:hypothetical protein